MKTHFPLFIFLIILLTACGSDPSSQWKETNLIEYGLPLKVSAPDSIDVKVGKLGDMQDVTIEGPDGYSLQIFGMNINTTQLSTLVSEQRDLVQDEAYFKKFEEEWDAGFMYSTQIDSAQMSYDFRHIKVQGDKQYVFQAGIYGSKSKEQIQRMIDAVRHGGKQ